MAFFQLPEELIFMKNSRIPHRVTEERLDGKTAVISGATSGVGRAAALRLAAYGARILFFARSPERAQALLTELKGLNKEDHGYALADFSRLNEVRKASAELLERAGEVSLLINSAGVHSTRRILTEEGHELVYAVNHLATFLITSLFLGRLKETKGARIIQVNSEGHRFATVRPKDLTWKKRPYFGLGGYGASKTAQLLCVHIISRLLGKEQVSINAMHPGAVRTRIGSQNGLLYRLWLHLVIWPTLKDPKISGEAIHFLAADPSMEGTTGLFFNLTHEELPAKHARNESLARGIFFQTIGQTETTEIWESLL